MYPCSTICARNVAECPEQVRPSCPAGQNYCVDGVCRENCPSDLKSACSCTFEDPIVGDLYPCNAGQRVNIEHFLSTNMTAQTAEVCANDLGISMASVEQWSNNPASLMWNTCPAPSKQLKFTEPAFIALYTFYGSLVAMLIGWTLYKRTLEKVGKENKKKMLPFLEPFIFTNISLSCFRLFSITCPNSTNMFVNKLKRSLLMKRKKLTVQIVMKRNPKLLVNR